MPGQMRMVRRIAGIAALLASALAPGLGPVSAGAAEVACTPANVAVYTNRIHVKCTSAFSGIQWFATSTFDAAHAARVLSVLSTALAAGRTLSITYDPADTSAAAWGCNASDCREILGVVFWQ